MSTERGFWTRRRAAVAAEAVEDQRLEEAAVVETREAEMAARSDEEILQELNLPDPDTLCEGDDFKVFLTETVPARIRTRALRRLWSSNPILANVDGLVDYGEDFTDASCVIENLQTAYQVGKGMTAHVDELARQAELAAEVGEAAEAEEPSDEELALIDSTADLTAESETDTSETDTNAPEEASQDRLLTAVDSHLEEDDPAETPMPLRRMQFRFEPEGAEA